MNEPIAIPDEAGKVVAEIVRSAYRAWTKMANRDAYVDSFAIAAAGVAVHDAAPFIVAAELDRMADYYWPESDVADYDQSEEDEREGVRSMCTVLRNRAAALRSTVEGGQS